MPDLNEQVEVVVQDAEVITVPIDDTLSNSGEAADAKAVGDALALKADKTELQNTITVNGQAADAQGKIIVTAADTKMSSSDNTTVKAKIEAVDGKTAADIYVSSTPGAETIAEALQNGVDRTANQIAMSSTDSTTVKDNIDSLKGSVTNLQSAVATVDAKTAAQIPYNTGSAETIKQHVDALDQGLVKTVNEYGPDANGNIHLERVPYADNLYSEETDQVNGEFIQRTTGGDLAISGNKGWILSLQGNRVHAGFVPESIQMTVTAIQRQAPPAITAVLDEATFEAYVETAGTYSVSYTDSWDHDPADYGLTISNTPISGDVVTMVWDGVSNAQVSVSAAPRTIPDPITATIDRNTFVSYVDSSQTITLTYTTGWSADPTLYGITVSNDPVNGDSITVVYVKEVRGTITVATPTGIKATGWNQYNHTNGYAYVLKYSNTYGYLVGGTYTSLAFATTPTGTQTPITPDAGGLFTVPSDGYVIVTGGDATSTYILPTWSDWDDGPDGSFEAYTESTIDLSTTISGTFPNGMFRVGDVRDEIDFNTKTAISRIQRMAYTAENLAAAKASGRGYEYDENYIYLVRDTESVSAISASDSYTCSDHGFEFITGTSVAAYTEIIYGSNLKDKLRRDVITYRMTVGDIKGM